MNSKSARVTLEEKLQATTSPWDRLPILIELTGEPTHDDADAHHRYAQEALQLAKQLNDPFWIACSMRAIGIYMRRTARYAEVLDYLKEASRIFGQLNDHRMKAQTDVPIADTYVYMGKGDEALKLLIPSLHFFETQGSSVWIAITLRAIGEVFKMIGDHGKAITYYRQALSVAVDSDHKQQQAAFSQQLADTYRRMGDRQAERKYLFRSLAIFREIGHTVGVAVTLGNIANMYLDWTLYDRAERFIRPAGRMYRHLRYTSYEGMSWGQLGTVYTHNGNYAKAFRCFRKGIQLAKEGENLPVLGTLYEQLGRLLIQMQEYDRAISCLKKSLSFIKKFGQPFFDYGIHWSLSTVYEAIGDAPKALRHMKEYFRLKEEFTNSQKIKEASRAEAQDKLRSLNTELQSERSRSEALKEAVKEKESELVSMALNLIRNAEEHRKQSGTPGSLTNNMREPLTESWNLFARQFYKVHHGFYPNLIQRYPNLTPTEIKVCSLIRIGLSTKEIAGILCVAKRTVDNHRARIHAKMRLPQASSLSGFIIRM